MSEIEVTIIVAVRPARLQAIVSAFAAESVHVDVRDLDEMRMPPTRSTYIFWLDVALAGSLAERLVAWSRDVSTPTAIIGVVEDGTGAHREALLAAGFDDAVTDTRSVRELAARVRAVERRVRRGVSGTSRLRYGSFSLDVVQQVLFTDSSSITLTPIELSVMRELIRAAGRPLSREQLLERAWGTSDETEVTPRAVDNAMMRLRRKLPRPELLENVRGVGFRLATG